MASPFADTICLRRSLLQRIRQTVSGTMLPLETGAMIELTVSIGATCATDAARTFEALYLAADTAL